MFSAAFGEFVQIWKCRQFSCWQSKLICIRFASFGKCNHLWVDLLLLHLLLLIQATAQATHITRSEGVTALIVLLLNCEAAAHMLHVRSGRGKTISESFPPFSTGQLSNLFTLRQRRVLIYAQRIGNSCFGHLTRRSMCWSLAKELPKDQRRRRVAAATGRWLRVAGTSRWTMQAAKSGESEMLRVSRECMCNPKWQPSLSLAATEQPLHWGTTCVTCRRSHLQGRVIVDRMWGKGSGQRGRPLQINISNNGECFSKNPLSVRVCAWVCVLWAQI